MRDPLMTEATIQAELYHQCRLMGLRAVLEYNTPVGRMDLVVLSEDGKSVVAGVECKRPTTQSGRRRNENQTANSRQMRRYQTTGITMLILISIDRAEEVAKTIKDRLLVKPTNYVTIETIQSIKKTPRQRKVRCVELDSDIIFRTN